MYIYTYILYYIKRGSTTAVAHPYINCTFKCTYILTFKGRAIELSHFFVLRTLPTRTSCGTPTRTYKCTFKGVSAHLSYVSPPTVGPTVGPGHTTRTAKCTLCSPVEVTGVISRTEAGSQTGKPLQKMPGHKFQRLSNLHLNVILYVHIYVHPLYILQHNSHRLSNFHAT